MPFREDGKYYLMLGYDLLRDLALEIGRRLEIGDDVFLLTLEEMFDALNIGFAPTHLLAQRKIARRAEKRIPLPHVIDGGNIETSARRPGSIATAAIQAFAISPGGATGPAGSSAPQPTRATSAEATSSSAPAPTQAGPPCSPTPPA